jgi:hypothetical protein
MHNGRDTGSSSLDEFERAQLAKQVRERILRAT